MSLLLDLAKQVNRNVVLPTHGDGAATYSGSTLYVLDDTQTPFVANVQPAPEIMPEFLIDHDPREMLTVDVPCPIQGTYHGVTRCLESNDLIIYGVTKLKLLRFEANPASIVTRYWFQKLVPGKDN